MAESGDEKDFPRAEPPLWTIGLAVLIILLAPVLLYSLAPTGPLREGDTIFSQGQQRVTRAAARESESVRSDEVCLLDPDHPLIILRAPGESPVMLAQVQGSAEWPFCPSHSEVFIGSHQIYQKPDVVTRVQQWLAGWLAR